MGSIKRLGPVRPFVTSDKKEYEERKKAFADSAMNYSAARDYERMKLTTWDSPERLAAVKSYLGKYYDRTDGDLIDGILFANSDMDGEYMAKPGLKVGDEVLMNDEEHSSPFSYDIVKLGDEGMMPVQKVEYRAPTPKPVSRPVVKPVVDERPKTYNYEVSREVQYPNTEDAQVWRILVGRNEYNLNPDSADFEQYKDPRYRGIPQPVTDSERNAWNERFRMEPYTKEMTEEEAKELEKQGYTVRRYDFGGPVRPFSTAGIPLDVLIDSVRNSNAEFAQRLSSRDTSTMADWGSTGYRANYKMGSSDNLVYPNVVKENGRWTDFTRPPYSPQAGYYNAINTGNYVEMPSERDAIWFGKNYKYIPEFRNESFEPKFDKGGPSDFEREMIERERRKRVTSNFGISDGVLYADVNYGRNFYDPVYFPNIGGYVYVPMNEQAKYEPGFLAEGYAQVPLGKWSLNGNVYYRDNKYMPKEKDVKLGIGRRIGDLELSGGVGRHIGMTDDFNGDTEDRYYPYFQVSYKKTIGKERMDYGGEPDSEEYFKSYLDSQGFKDRFVHQWDKEQTPYGITRVGSVDKWGDPKFDYETSGIDYFNKTKQRYALEMRNSLKDDHVDVVHDNTIEDNWGIYLPSLRTIKIADKYADVLPHEYGHAYDIYMPHTINGEIKGGVKVYPHLFYQVHDKKDIKPEDIEHDSLPEESYADLMSVRYWLYKNGIYDSRNKEKITDKQIDEARKKLNESKSNRTQKRFFNQFNNEQIKTLINDIAFNNRNTLTAKKGGIL